MHALGKQTLQELSRQTQLSVRTLQRKFDELNIEQSFKKLFNLPLNLIVDATFFTRSDGVLIYRANRKNLYWQFIKSETMAEVTAGLDKLDALGYQFKSVTVDGRKGMILLFKHRYPVLPIQMCQFHQAQIIRRYTTNNPKTECSKALKAIMTCLTTSIE